MRSEDADQFFSGIAGVLPRDKESLPYFLAMYRMGLFSPALFEQYALDFPAHIRNSVVKRQAEFMAGRLCARTILSGFGLGKHVVAVGSQREPLWPDGFIGSITHSGEYAAAIACPGKDILGIGIDIETRIKAEAREAMLELVVCAEELACLQHYLDEMDLDCLLTMVFSAKESFFKAAFAQVKAFFDFDALKVTRIDTAACVIHFRCVQNLSPRLLAGQAHQAHYHFIGETSIFTAVVLKNEALAMPPAEFMPIA